MIVLRKFAFRFLKFMAGFWPQAAEPNDDCPALFSGANKHSGKNRKHITKSIAKSKAKSIAERMTKPWQNA